MNRKTNGFTLVEVLIALGIAGGAFILLLSANRASLRRSQRAVQSSRLELLAQSKLDELRAGAESATRGTFPELPDCEWRVSIDSAECARVKELKRLTLHVTRQGESTSHDYSVLQYVKKDGPK